MKKEFVPHELALELKRLGFDEPCLGRWLVITEWEAPTGEVRLQLGTDVEDYDNHQFHAPLFQQAFRWFRDNHKHNGIVEGCKKYGFEWCIYPDIEHYIKPPNNFNTYEEAELACITRLIEIVKSNTNEK